MLNLLKRYLKIIIIVVIILAIFLIYLLIQAQSIDNPRTWVISQGLYQTIAKQKALEDRVKGDKVTFEDIIEVSTSSALPKEKVEKLDNGYLLTTGSLGEVVADIEQGLYKVSVVPVPGLDIIAPYQVKVGSVKELRLGLRPGSGKILGSGEKQALKARNASGKAGKLVIHLYHDESSNGKKDFGEPTLKWAGIIIQLSR